MIRILLISAIFLLNSCATYKPNGFSEVKQNKEEISSFFFEKDFSEYVFKSNLSVYGNELSGLVIIKKIKSNVHRVVFTTDFGNTLIDFEITPNDFKVNYIVEDLDRKIILNVLKEDFRLLLNEKHQVVQQFTNDSIDVYKEQLTTKRFNYLYFKDNNLVKLVNTSKTKERIFLNYNQSQNIKIVHKNIKLKIDLKRIK